MLSSILSVLVLVVIYLMIVVAGSIDEFKRFTDEE